MLRVNKTARVSDSNGFKKMFAPGRLTLGVFFPIEAFERDEPTMRDPSFGDILCSRSTSI